MRLPSKKLMSCSAITRRGASLALRCGTKLGSFIATQIAEPNETILDVVRLSIEDAPDCVE
jgi:hypothetical protein